MSKLRRNSCYLIVNNDGRVIGQCNGNHVDGTPPERVTAYSKHTHEAVSWDTLIQDKNAPVEVYINALDKQFDVTATPMTIEGIPCCLVEFLSNDPHGSCYLSLPSSHRLNSIIESTDAGTWEWNVQTDELIINERWASMVGYTIEELKPISTKTWLSILHKADHEKFQRVFQSHVLGKTSFYSADLRLKHKQGHEVWIRDHGKIVTRTEEGEPEWFSGTHIDITELKQLERELKSSQKTLQTAQEIAQLGYWSFTLSDNSLTWSPIIFNMLGLSPKTTAASLFLFKELLHPDDENLFEDSRERLFNSKVFDKTHRIRHSDGHYLWVHIYAQWQQDGEVLVGTIHDITQQKELELELLNQSRIDSLTGLANRRYFIEQIERAITRSKRTSSQLSLLVIDVDLFKKINDRFGHSTGDRVLEKLAKIMSERVRSSDLVARIGGEEFAVMLPDTTINDAFKLAEELKEAVNSQPIQLKDNQLSLSVTIGVSSLSDENSNWSSLYGEADNAMYQGKKDGRNRVFITK